MACFYECMLAGLLTLAFIWLQSTEVLGRPSDKGGISELTLLFLN